MQLLHALALVAALCMGSGAATDLRGAVRAGGYGQCNCNFAGGDPVVAWPVSECYCPGACSGTCCYFSQPQSLPQLESYCQCQGEKQTIFGIYTACDSGAAAKWPLQDTEIGDNFWVLGEAQAMNQGDPYWYSTPPQSWYTSPVFNN